MSYELPTSEQLGDVASDLERIRESMSSTLRQRMAPHSQEIHAAVEVTRARLKQHLGGPRVPTVAPGDTLEFFDAVGYKKTRDSEEYAKFVKARKDAQAPKLHGVVTAKSKVASAQLSNASAFDNLSNDSRFDGQTLDNRSRIEAADSSLTAASRFEGVVIDDASRLEAAWMTNSERPKAPKMPGDPSTFADAMQPIAVLNLWKDRKSSDFELAIAKVTKNDGFAAAAVGDPRAVFTERQRLEVKRIINSEWGIDLSYGSHDYALPTAFGAQREGLNAVQNRIVDVLIAIASRSVLKERYSQSGLSIHKPFGGLMSDPGSILEPPNRLRGIVSLGNWELGLHGDNASILDRVKGVVAPDRDSWLGDQLDFVQSFLAPSVRDRMGEHRTLVDVELAPWRTMLNIRSQIGGAPEVMPLISSDGRVSLYPILKDNDPLYDRNYFTPNWHNVRNEVVWRNVDRSDSTFLQALSANDVNPAVVRAHYFNPYDQRIELIDTRATTPKKFKDDGDELRLFQDVQVDHILAIKYAWDRGFRELFLGSLGDPARRAKVLRAMTDFGQGEGLFRRDVNFAIATTEQNQEKSDKGPDRWLPHNVALTTQEHLGNLYYINHFRQVQTLLRATQFRLDGYWDPNFMPTSQAEKRVMRRVAMGWDQGSRGVYGRAQQAARDFWLETMLEPDLSEEPFYIQARKSALMMHVNMGVNAALWRLVPWNQAYLTGRKYVKPFLDRGWAKMTGDAVKPLPSYFSNFRSEAVNSQNLTSFLSEWASQGGVVDYYRGGDLLRSRARRVVAPTLKEAFLYAFGSKNPFSWGEFSSKLSPSELSSHPDFARFHRSAILSNIKREGGGYGALRTESVLWSWRNSSSLSDFTIGDGGEYWNRGVRTEVYGLRSNDALLRDWRRYVTRDFRRQLRSEALAEFGSQFSRVRRSIPSRAPLDAAPMVTDIARLLSSGRAEGTSLRRLAARSTGIVAVDFAIKGLDYGLRSLGDWTHVLGNFSSIIPIVGSETVSSLVATATGQETYVSPLMGRRSLLGHDPFALSRGFTRENARLTFNSFRPLGGIDQLEALRGELRAQAQAATLTAAQASRREKLAQNALWAGSVNSSRVRLSELADHYQRAMRISESGDAVRDIQYFASISGESAPIRIKAPHEMTYEDIWGLRGIQASPAPQHSGEFRELLSNIRGGSRSEWLPGGAANPSFYKFSDISSRSVELGNMAELPVEIFRHAGLAAPGQAARSLVTIKGAWYPGFGAPNLGRAMYSSGSTPRTEFNPDWLSAIAARERSRGSIFDYRRTWLFPLPREVPSEHQSRQIISRDWRIDIPTDEAMRIVRSRMWHSWGAEEQLAYDAYLAESGVWRSRVVNSPDVLIDAPLYAPSSNIGPRPSYGRRPITTPYRHVPAPERPVGGVTSTQLADWSAINPPERGLYTFSVNGEFDIFENAAQRASLQNRINQFEQAAEARVAAVRAARAARARIFSTFRPEIQAIIDSKGLSRFLLDLQLSNPHMTMFAGRALHAPISVGRGVGKVAKAFTLGSLENLTLARSAPMSTGRRLVSGAFRYGGLGLSAFGALEELSRFDRAVDMAGQGWQNLSEEERTDLINYAHRSPVETFFGAGVSALTLDPIGSMTASFASFGSGFASALLSENDGYRSEFARGVFSGDATMRDSRNYRARLKRMNDAGIFPGEGDSVATSTIANHLREVRIKQESDLKVLVKRQEMARTTKQVSASKKALRLAGKAIRYTLTGTTAEGADLAATADSLARLAYPSEDTVSRMPMWTSVGYRTSDKDLNLFSLTDSLRMASMMSGDSGLDMGPCSPFSRDKRLDSYRKAYSGDLQRRARIILDAPSTARSSGFGGFLNRYEQRGLARERIEAIRREQRDSLVRAGRMSSWVANGGHSDPLISFFRNIFVPLDSAERADLARDTLQAAQRRPR